MKKLVYILLILSFSSICGGCIFSYSNTETEVKSFSAFNDESYIWEGFIYPTNRTEVIK